MKKQLFQNVFFKSILGLLFLVVLIILLFFNPVLPIGEIGSFLILNALLDVDVAQIMADEEFEKQNPDLYARGGRMIFYDPLAYTIEVHGYTKSGEEFILAKKEIYRVYWWGKVAKSENLVTKFLRFLDYAFDLKPEG
jgi:hypothetical protein